YRCDQSLIDAIKNTTPPTITNNVARITIQTENISFIFKQS
ncbi:protein TolA, partial [Francisella tularensis subsp. holarctica]|nr:protein TolA [Francisella tularensis subsp. holarctica]